jgi:hypothetical protein
MSTSPRPLPADRRSRARHPASFAAVIWHPGREHPGPPTHAFFGPFQSEFEAEQFLMDFADKVAWTDERYLTDTVRLRDPAAALKADALDSFGLSGRPLISWRTRQPGRE